MSRNNLYIPSIQCIRAFHHSDLFLAAGCYKVDAPWLVCQCEGHHWVLVLSIFSHLPAVRQLYISPMVDKAWLIGEKNICCTKKSSPTIQTNTYHTLRSRSCAAPDRKYRALLSGGRVVAKRRVVTAVEWPVNFWQRYRTTQLIQVFSVKTRAIPGWFETPLCD